MIHPSQFYRKSNFWNCAAPRRWWNFPGSHLSLRCLSSIGERELIDKITKGTTEAKERETENGHTFLKVDFEPSFAETLHDIMLDFKKHFEEGMGNLKNRKSSLDLPVRPIHINVRSIEDISSMTLFDASDRMTRLARSDIYRYNRKLTRRLKRDGFLREDLTQPIVGEFHHWYFHVKKLMIAPLTTMDRIDAILEPSPHWKCLHRDLQELADLTPGLRRTVSTEECERWLPSLTLADITNGIEGCTMAEQFLRRFIKVLQYPLFKEVISSRRQNISMGGDKPIYSKLKWNFTFRERPLIRLRPQQLYSIDYAMLRNPLVDDYGYENLEEVEETISDSEIDAQTEDILVYDPMDLYVVPLEDLEPVEDDDVPIDEVPFVQLWEEEDLEDHYWTVRNSKKLSKVQNQDREKDASSDVVEAEVHDSNTETGNGSTS